jgi:GxxExxY protein
MSEEYAHKDLTHNIIHACYAVHNQLGHGFLEIVYKDGLEIELNDKNLPFAREVGYEVEYNGMILPHVFYADFVVQDKVILEIKAKSGIVDADLAQTINYLKCSGCQVGLIVNFGRTSVEVRRVSLTQSSNPESANLRQNNT